MRQVPGLWPAGEYDSGRVLLTAAHVHGFELVSATVYLPPKGPTYPRAVELCSPQSLRNLFWDVLGTGLSLAI